MITIKVNLIITRILIVILLQEDLQGETEALSIVPVNTIAVKTIGLRFLWALNPTTKILIAGVQEVDLILQERLINLEAAFQNKKKQAFKTSGLLKALSNLSKFLYSR